MRTELLLPMAHLYLVDRKRFFSFEVFSSYILITYHNPHLLALSTLLQLLLLSVTPETAAYQAPLSMGFSRQEYWSGLSFPSPMNACMLSHFSHVQLCVTPWTAAHQAPLSTGFSRQEYWSGWPFPSPGTVSPFL